MTPSPEQPNAAEQPAPAAQSIHTAAVGYEHVVQLLGLHSRALQLVVAHAALLVLIVGGVAVYFMGRDLGAEKAGRELAQQQLAVLQHGQDSLRHLTDSLRAVSARAQVVYIRDTVKLRSVYTVHDTVLAAAGDSIATPTVKAMVGAERAQCSVVMLACQERAVAAEAERDNAFRARDNAFAQVRSYQAMQPSRLRRLWETVKLPVGFVAGVWLGNRVRP
jgi:hypothetical protein